MRVPLNLSRKDFSHNTICLNDTEANDKNIVVNEIVSVGNKFNGHEQIYTIKNCQSNCIVSKRLKCIPCDQFDGLHPQIVMKMHGF